MLVGNLISHKVSYFIVLAACILVVLGDLRGLITPAGYWLVWGAITVVGIISWCFRGNLSVSREMYGYGIGFLLLLSSFMLSALSNLSLNTMYQGFKIILIFICFVCIFVHSHNLKAKDIYSISVTSIVVGFLCYVFSRFMFPEFHVSFGDGRQGSRFALPGVLWKTCAFFVGFVFVGIVFDSKSKFFGVAVICMAVYLLVMDSSRTGFVVFLFVCLLVFFMVLYFSPVIAVSLFLALAFVFGLSVLINTEFYNFIGGDNVVILERLAAGDPVRAEMIDIGISHIFECLPFGCGFGSAVIPFNGTTMVVHNAYISSAGDIGLLGFLSIVYILLCPFIVFFIRMFKKPLKQKKLFCYVVVALAGCLGYAFLLMLHPFSTELSEWGIWIVMVSASSSLTKIKTSFESVSLLKRIEH